MVEHVYPPNSDTDCEGNGGEEDHPHEEAFNGVPDELGEVADEVEEGDVAHCDGLVGVWIAGGRGCCGLMGSEERGRGDGLGFARSLASLCRGGWWKHCDDGIDGGIRLRSDRTQGRGVDSCTPY